MFFAGSLIIWAPILAKLAADFADADHESKFYTELYVEEVHESRSEWIEPIDEIVERMRIVDGQTSIARDRLWLFIWIALGATAMPPLIFIFVRWVNQGA